MSFAGFYGATSELEFAGRAREGRGAWRRLLGHRQCLRRRLERIDRRPLSERGAGRRARITLATKFGIRRLADGSRTFNNDADYLRDCLEASLTRLGVDHIDLYYVHRIDRRIPVEETIGALSRYVENGKIGAIGLSEVAPDTLRRAAAIHPIAAVQSEYSLWTRTAELGLLQACAEVGATLVAFSPVARGFFSGLLQQTETFAPGDFRRENPRFQGLQWRRNRDRLDPFLALARIWGVAPATLAVAWTLAKAPHILPIPGTRSADHLAECAAAASLALSNEQVEQIERILPAGFASGERYSEKQWVGVERY